MHSVKDNLKINEQNPLPIYRYTNNQREKNHKLIENVDSQVILKRIQQLSTIYILNNL